MRSPFRIVYRAIIRMHPAAFRAEFGEEMLWIFDEESHRGFAPHLLLDGIRSIVIQNVKPRTRQTETVGPYYCEINSSLPVFRFTQAGLIVLSCFCCLFCFSLFLSMVIPKLTAPDRDWLFTRIRIISSVPAPGLERSSH